MGASRDTWPVIRGDGRKEPLWIPNNRVVALLSVLLLFCGLVIGVLYTELHQVLVRAEDYERRMRALTKELNDTNATTFLWMSSVKVECAKAGVDLPIPPPELMEEIHNGN